MNKLLFIFAMMVAIAAHAQNTQTQSNSGLGFNYQAVVRNESGVVLVDTTVNLRVSLYPGRYASAPTWVETHEVQTDFSGCFGITVGKGERDNSSIAQYFTDVNFSAVYYWLKIEILEGGTYREISYSQLPSSPYAEVAYNAFAIPAGVIVPFGGEEVPFGWMLCDGAEVSRTEYANLYNAIGVCWGIGDGATTFNLPDMRGVFLRGVSGASGNDEDAEDRLVLNDNGGNTGNNVGSYQGDAIRNITGSMSPVRGFQTNPSVRTTSGAFNSTDTGLEGGRNSEWRGASIITFDASRVVPVGNDNRPKNVYVNYIIKY
ncbi:MAG: tail fiber protein [Bacteroidales bacterium]|nr:tail fiber protein [Bacteroidales bacterium]